MKLNIAKTIIFCSVLMLASSCQNAGKPAAIAVEDQSLKTEYSLMNPDSCRQVALLGDDGQPRVMSAADARQVIEFLNKATLNDKRNSGMKFKMRTPDYSLLIEMAGQATEIVQLWDMQLLLYSAKWYDLPTENNIVPLLEKYMDERKK